MEMSGPVVINVNGVKYTRMRPNSEGYYAIVVCDRGFVLYGSVCIKDDFVIIDDCCCIRRWGTTGGLGELANDGPTDQTKLDRQPQTRVHQLQVVQIIDCVGGPWKQ